MKLRIDTDTLFNKWVQAHPLYIRGGKGDFGTILTYKAFTLTELPVEVVRSSRPVSRGSTNLWLTCRASQRHSADTPILLNGCSHAY